MAGRNQRRPLKALFIGNSFTARNDLPGLVAQLAAARGRRLEHRLISAGGASLRTHWNAGVALEAIRGGQYDHVVLQEQSTLPIKNARRMHENVRLFDEAIKAAGAQTTLYMTWARRNAPQSQQAITDAYAGIGRELAATVVPVGLAWQRFSASTTSPSCTTGTRVTPPSPGPISPCASSWPCCSGRAPSGLTPRSSA